MHSTPRSVHKTNRVFGVIWFFVFVGAWLGSAIAVCLWPFRFVLNGSLSLSLSVILFHFHTFSITSMGRWYTFQTIYCYHFGAQLQCASHFIWESSTRPLTIFAYVGRATWLVACDLCRCRGCRPWCWRKRRKYFHIEYHTHTNT